MESSTNFNQKPYLSRTRPIFDRFDHVWLGKSSWWAPELSKSKNIPGIAPAATDSHQISRVSKNIDFEGSYLRFSTGGGTAEFPPPVPQVSEEDLLFNMGPGRQRAMGPGRQRVKSAHAP